LSPPLCRRSANAGWVRNALAALVVAEELSVGVEHPAWRTAERSPAGPDGDVEVLADADPRPAAVVGAVPGVAVVRPADQRGTGGVTPPACQMFEPFQHRYAFMCGRTVLRSMPGSLSATVLHVVLAAKACWGVKATRLARVIPTAASASASLRLSILRMLLKDIV
jgi:hypothetical protein